MRDLKSFFEPKAVAVIGASNKPEKLGYQILRNILNGFQGKLYPVNPKELKILGLKAYEEIGAIKPAPDLAVIVIPATFVLEEIKKCATAGVKNLIIISAGFGESGPDGKILETELKALAAKYKLNILGPNCLGLISSDVRLNATFAEKTEFEKDAAAVLISQSGAVGSAVLDFLAGKNIGLNSFVSLGNKAVMDESDFFEYLAEHKKINLVVAYLESIVDGCKFMSATSRLALKKPVAILKAGRTSAGAKAAMSHTGSLAGSNAAVLTGLKRAGVIILDDLEDLFDLLILSERQRLLEGDLSLSIISNAGGALVLSVDAAVERQITLDITRDIIGDADAERYRKNLVEVLRTSKAAAVLVLLTPQTSTEIEKTAEVIVELQKKYPRKLLLASFVGGQSLIKAEKILGAGGIPSFKYPERAVRIVDAYFDYLKKRATLKPYIDKKSENKTSPEELKNIQLDYLKSFAMLKKYKIPAVKTTKADLENLRKAKYPAVLKIVGPKLIHKTDAKAIFLNIKNYEEAATALKSSPAFKQADNYAVIQEKIKGGQELILGFKRDAAFGPLLMLGQGGIYTEVLKDIVFEVDDLDLKRAQEMISSLKIFPILNGARGTKPLALATLAQTLVALAKLAKENPQISELDINPLFIDEAGVKAADVRIII